MDHDRTNIVCGSTIAALCVSFFPHTDRLLVRALRLMTRASFAFLFPERTVSSLHWQENALVMPLTQHKDARFWLGVVLLLL